MTEADRKICRVAAAGMYRAAGMEPPPPERIVFVPSPFALRFAGGAAAWRWYGRVSSKGATWAATREATGAATRDAVSVATEDAVSVATWEATREATEDATRAATRAATRDAIEDATRDATWEATWAATEDATRDAIEDAVSVATGAATRDAVSVATEDATWYVGPRGLPQMSVAERACARKVFRMWQGGNQWSGYDSYLSFFDRVVGLDLPEYGAWRHWEALSLHSGPRIVHEKFCMISDRPERLLVDSENRPHCDDGPFCRWRDGSALYAIHGVRVPVWVVEHPERITAQSIDAETNVEVRRVMLERYGADRYMRDSGATLVHEDGCGKLWRKDIASDEPMVMVEVVNSTPEPDGSVKTYWLRVPPDTTTATEAVAWTFNTDPAEYAPQVES